MRVILFQRGATSWGFQIGRAYLNINYPEYWVLRGRMMDGSRRASFASWGWERD